LLEGIDEAKSKSGVKTQTSKDEIGPSGAYCSGEDELVAFGGSEMQRAGRM